MRFKEDYGGTTVTEIEVNPDTTSKTVPVHKGHQKLSSFLKVSHVWIFTGLNFQVAAFYLLNFIIISFNGQMQRERVDCSGNI
jgi:hypothetical protein